MFREPPFLKRYGPLALVAGALEGLGEAFAEVLASWGFKIVLVARREEKLNAVAHRLEHAYGVTGSPHIAAYAAGKAFITTFAQGLWQELQKDGVDVTSCVAGAVRTPGFNQAVESGNPKEAPGTLDAPVVVRTALKALGRKPVIVPGAVNKMAQFLFRRLVSVKTAIRIMAMSTTGLGDASSAQINTLKDQKND